VVALAIGVALIAVTRLPRRGLHWRSVMLAIAIVAGATAGEFLLLAIGAIGAPGSLAAMMGRIARWSVIAGSVAVMFYLWRRATEADAAAQAIVLRRVQLERQAAAARLAALRGQIEPHFLFNTLATVRRLLQTNASRGAPLLGHFISYLRSAQPRPEGEGHTLGQEIALTQAYLSVVGARMSNRLRVRFDVPDELAAQPFPPLTIATLVENAVRHGIAPLPAGGEIAVSVKSIGGSLEAVVEDTGVGFSGISGSGIGLANIRARLLTVYGSAATLTLQNNLPTGVRASMRLPCRPAGVSS
jgi:LytS/YehU family sensor histidine kinase